MMHIRKWLRILINRSLVLGTIDRPSVHDLVLDFTVAQHSADELCLQHGCVVNAFRDTRPADAFGRRRFDKSVSRDPLCIYVCDEVGHHATVVCQRDTGQELGLSWLADTPQDAIVMAAAKALGVKRLLSLAESAESTKDWWLAARHYSILQAVTQDIEGAAAAYVPCSKALDALEKVLSDSQSQSESESESVDEVILRTLNIWLQSIPENQHEELVAHIQGSEVEKRNPVGGATIKLVKTPGLLVQGNLLECVEIMYNVFSSLTVASRTHAIEETRYTTGIMAFNAPNWAALYPLAADFSWDVWCGEGGCDLILAAKQYDFDRDHRALIEGFWGDLFIWSGGAAGPLAMHWGDITSANDNLAMALAVLRGPVKNQEHLTGEAVGIVFMAGAIPCMCYHCHMAVDHRTEITAFMSDWGLNWHDVDEAVDAMAAMLPFVRNRGADTAPDMQTVSSEYCAWWAKTGWYLCAAEPGVSAAEVAESLPSIDDILASNPLEPCSLLSNCEFSNLFVNVGCVWEKIGRHAEALSYATAALENDLAHCGAIAPSVRVFAHMLQGRSHAALGNTKAAADAFEAAVELAQKYELWLLQALALKDLKLLVFDGLGHRDHGSRRLGEVLRLLVGPAEVMTPLMDGLDAGELMRLPPPDAGYQVAFEQQEEEEDQVDLVLRLGLSVPSLRALRAELSAMKVKALKQRAREFGAKKTGVLFFCGVFI